MEFGRQDESEGFGSACREGVGHGLVVAESAEVVLLEGEGLVAGLADAFEVGGGRDEGDGDEERDACEEDDPAADGCDQPVGARGFRRAE